jgi:hypothetical protein
MGGGTTMGRNLIAMVGVAGGAAATHFAKRRARNFGGFDGDWRY